ncbi:MAG: DUF1727 domain-containing protein [Clostridia bacterium]|nr:DUF1727 domain-containing protein [Clostridia bacterium]
MNETKNKNDFRFFVALYVAKAAKNSLKLLGKLFKVNGSHVPGTLAIKICPDFLSIIDKPKKVIAVTGTNGKTTTCNFITDSLKELKYDVLSNKFGSNIVGGITTTLLGGVTLRNKSKHDIAVLEVDERCSPLILPYINPDYVVVTNLFRDSLKRNAHSEYIFNIINRAISDTSTLILNADDLISNKMKANNSNKKVFFGINKLDIDLPNQNNIVNDAQICPICYSKLKYNFIRYHHIGSAYCENCHYTSPKTDFCVEKINHETNELVVSYNNNKINLNMISDSIFNIYNEIATFTLLKELGVKDEDIQNVFKNIEITKYRYTEEDINGYKIINHLSKGYNPIACSIVFQYVKNTKGNKEIVLLIEDYHDNKISSENIAWFYDCDFEFLNDDSIKKIIIPGKISKDIELRLLMTGIDKEKVVALDDESTVTDYLSFDKDNTIYILYDMYQQQAVDNVNNAIKKKILNITEGSGGEKND